MLSLSSGQPTFQPECPVDPVTLQQWRDDLETISPHNDQTSFLHLVYEPGWPWEPVGRFMLYDCPPLGVTKWEFLEEVRGPSPDTKTHYDPITGSITGTTLCNQTQWNIYQEIGRFSYPWWVIQGDKGGHKVQFTPREQTFLRGMDLPTTPPQCGSLPYAPFDNRVKAQIIKHDKLVKAYGDLKVMKHMNTAGSSYQQDEDKQFRRKLMTWLADQVRDPIKERVELLMQADAPRVRVNYDPEQRLEEAVETYVEHGR